LENKVRVIVAGGGTAGWLSAYSLAKRMGNMLEITLVESEQIGTVGVGEATIPTMRRFHQFFGVDEQEFMRETQGTFKLGIKFENWRKPGESYFHSFGDIGQSTWMAEFHQYWMEAQANGFGGSLDDYCLELKAAEKNKFAVKVGQTPLSYAFHLNATAYAKYLRKKSELLGVKRVEGKITKINIDGETGNINSLDLDHDRNISADFFLDCTGFRSLLLGQTLDVEYEDWSHWICSDRAIAVQTESIEPPKPLTTSTAHSIGWQWHIPLQTRTGNGIVFSSRFCSEDEALSTLLGNVKGKTTTEPRVIKFKTGRRVNPWQKNCVGIGLASGFIEPLESTSIHLINTSLVRLMNLFPFSGEMKSSTERFNRETRLEWEAVRDFIILHYKQTERDDSEFWNYYRTMDIPDTLAHRLEIFKESGYVWQDEVNLFRSHSWVQVMLGQGLTPEYHHRAGCMLSPTELKQQLEGISSNVNKNLAALPSHIDFVKQYCPAV